MKRSDRIANESAVRPLCVVEVGHGPTPAAWRHIQPEGHLLVCDRHRRQYNESDLGRFHWQAVAT